MSATISTSQHRRLPLATGLAIAGAITAAVALGVGWEQSHDSPAPAQAPALRTPTAQDYSLYNYYHGPHVGVAKPESVPNVRVAERELGTSTSSSSGVPNARIAEEQQQPPTPAPPFRGRGVPLGQ
jgi:hypothetical protein